VFRPLKAGLLKATVSQASGLPGRYGSSNVCFRFDAHVRS